MTLESNLSQLTKIAKRYRNSQRAADQLKEVLGRPIDQSTTRLLCLPLLGLWADAEIDPMTCAILEGKFADWVPRAETSLAMHLSPKTDGWRADQEVFDALIVGFLNNACIPLDLAMVPGDLLPEFVIDTANPRSVPAEVSEAATALEKPVKKRKMKRLQVELSEQEEALLEKLQQRMDAASERRVVRFGLQMAQWYFEEVDAGKNVIVRDQNGNDTQMKFVF